MKLVYYIQPHDRYIPLLEYTEGKNIQALEIVARQLCETFVVNGREYELLSNEMEPNNEDALLVKELGIPPVFSEEMSYAGVGLCIELRKYRPGGDMQLMKVIPCENYQEIVRYLLKDSLHVEPFGYLEVVSREIDEDREVFVIYVNENW